jgi:hypothetical protein
LIHRRAIVIGVASTVISAVVLWSRSKLLQWLTSLDTSDAILVFGVAFIVTMVVFTIWAERAARRDDRLMPAHARSTQQRILELECQVAALSGGDWQE